MNKNYPNKMGWPNKVIQKLWARVGLPEDYVKGVTNDKEVCLVWYGSFDSYGRPRFRLDGKYVQAKRAMFQCYYGPIDDGKIIANKCYNKKCVRPDHLYQKFFFMKETYARNGQRDPKDKRRKLRVVVKEKAILEAFDGINKGYLKSVADVGVYLNIDDHDVIDFLSNDQWEFINKHYTMKELNDLRKMVAISTV